MLLHNILRRCGLLCEERFAFPSLNVNVTIRVVMITTTFELRPIWRRMEASIAVPCPDIHKTSRDSSAQFVLNRSAKHGHLKRDPCSERAEACASNSDAEFRSFGPYLCRPACKTCNLQLQGTSHPVRSMSLKVCGMHKPLLQLPFQAETVQPNYRTVATGKAGIRMFCRRRSSHLNLGVS